MIGVNVFVEDKYIGTASDVEGNYSLTTDLAPPFTLVISAIGYTEQRLPIVEVETSLSPVLVEKPYMANDVVVSASRIKESYMSAPVTIEKMDILDVRRTPSASFYESLDNMRGVELKTTSIFNQSVTGRGVGSTKNTNFIQLIDGANNAPLANGSFAIGNLLGIPELDIASIEVMPGASSALYGPNAYSGIMHMNSKTPFFYQGLSAQVKTGTTSEDMAGSNPYYNLSTRYAKAYEKFAYKFTIDYTKAYDWGASDESLIVSDYEIAAGQDVPVGVTHTDNKVNLYGDEFGQSVNLDGAAGYPAGSIWGSLFQGCCTQATGSADCLSNADAIAQCQAYANATLPSPDIPVYRTGYYEKDLVDYNVYNTKLNTTVEYKLTDDLLASYSYRNAIGSSNFQSFNKYMLENIEGTYNQFQLKGSNYHLRGYVMNEDAGDSYDVVFTAWNMNRAAKSDGAWFADYIGAYLGGVQAGFTDYGGIYANAGDTVGVSATIPAFDANAARNFADNGGYVADGLLGVMATGDPASTATADGSNDLYISTAQADATPRLVPGTPEFEAALKTIKGTKNFLSGAGFVSTSSIYDFEGMYDFEDRLGFANLLIGGSYKMYKPFTKGSIYSDSDETVAEHGEIELNEYAVFGQISKSVLNNSLKLQATMRYDGHSNFEAHISPRVSAVYSLNDFQHIRASYQSGFSNPTVQDQYLNVNLGVQHLIGGIEQNVKRLGLTQLFTEGVIAVTDADGITSYETETTNYLQAEYQTSYEVGYKGLLSKNLFIDVNYYASEYTKPQGDKTVYDSALCDKDSDGNITSCSSSYTINTNKIGSDKLHGAGVSITYNFDNGYRIGGSYAFSDMNMEPSESFTLASGRPKNRIKLSLSNPNVINNLGFSIAARYSDEYYYWSGVTFGGGTIDSQTTVDAQLTYMLQQYQTSIKLGINNLLGTSYTQAIGGPSIGQTMYVTFTFDNMFN